MAKTVQIQLISPFLNESNKLFSELESKGIVFHKQSQRFSFLLLNFIQQNVLFYTLNGKIYVNLLFDICKFFKFA